MTRLVTGAGNVAEPALKQDMAAAYDKSKIPDRAGHH